VKVCSPSGASSSSIVMTTHLVAPSGDPEVKVLTSEMLV
jgi:hypothetical protein